MEIANMYQILFYDHITMILMKEIMLNKRGKKAEEVKLSFYVSRVSRSVQKLREFNEKQKVNLSKDFLDLHELMRAREEIVFLEAEASRFLGNLKLEADPIKQAVETLTGQDELTRIEAGKLNVLKGIQFFNTYLSQVAEDSLLADEDDSMEEVEVENVEEDDEVDDDESEEEKEEDDDDDEDIDITDLIEGVVEEE
ncbi:hypothetical protein ABG067_007943, partial [Albugo candida]